MRRRFATSVELVTGLYAALVQYLETRELLRFGPFDAAPCFGATLDDLDVEDMYRFIRTARRARQFPLPPETPPPDLLRHLNLLNRGRLTNVQDPAGNRNSQKTARKQPESRRKRRPVARNAILPPAYPRPSPPEPLREPPRNRRHSRHHAIHRPVPAGQVARGREDRAHRSRQGRLLEGPGPIRGRARPYPRTQAPEFAMSRSAMGSDLSRSAPVR